jgi:putative hemolysin
VDSKTLLLVLALLLTSAFLSSAEIALFSLSRVQLRLLRERLRGQYKKIKMLLMDPGGLLITILVINEVVNVSLSTVFTKLISNHPSWLDSQLHGLPIWLRDSLLSALITTPIILIFCEITPKVIGARANELVSTLTARPLAAIYEVFAPIRIFIRSFLKKTPGIGLEDSVLKESEFMMLLEEGRKEGAVQASEVELIRNVFDMDDMTVAEILTPLSRVTSMPSSLTLKEALVFARSHSYSRIPVYQGQKRQIIGVIYAKDLLQVKLDSKLNTESVTELMRRPVTVQSTMRLSSVFRRFKQQKTHLALVQNAKKECLGIVTLNDVIQALFEELPEALEPKSPTGATTGASSLSTSKGIQR